MRRRTAARSHPTARPTNTPPVPTTTNRPAAPMRENAPVTAAATATRYATIAAASLIMLSPSRMVTTRSEERRVGKECRSRWALDDEKKEVLILKEEHGDVLRREA